MFHYEEKLKDLKVHTRQSDGAYVIHHKQEEAIIEFNGDEPKRFTLRYNYDGFSGLTKNAHHIVVGEGNLKRDVYHFSTPDGPLPTLRCGYTVHNGENTWSSTPHPFEMNPKSGFEEVFLYLLSSGTWEAGKAIQVGKGKWTDGDLVDSIWSVKDSDISAIPMGYHPVVGEPGVHVSYIWAYLAKHKEWEKLP